MTTDQPEALTVPTMPPEKDLGKTVGLWVCGQIVKNSHFPTTSQTFFLSVKGENYADS